MTLGNSCFGKHNTLRTKVTWQLFNKREVSGAQLTESCGAWGRTLDAYCYSISAPFVLRQSQTLILIADVICSHKHWRSWITNVRFGHHVWVYNIIKMASYNLLAMYSVYTTSYRTNLVVQLETFHYISSIADVARLVRNAYELIK